MTEVAINLGWLLKGYLLDIGTPLNPQSGDAPVQVYVSLGQAF